MKESKVNNILSFSIREPKDEEAKVSYSQYSMYAKCPHQWKLRYVDKHRMDEPNIYLVFGTAMHEVIQDWLDIIYNKSLQEAKEMDLGSMLQAIMVREYTDLVEKHGSHFSTPEELEGFLRDGVEILDFISRHRVDYFNTRQLRLLAVELPLYHKILESHNVYMLGYIDLVFEDTYDNSIQVWDIKTSTAGWNKYQKADKIKISQLVLYKKYLAEQFGFDVNKINVMYFIVKRKLHEGMVYAQKRVQTFKPANGSVTLNKTLKQFENFVKMVFNEDGTYNTETKHPAIAGKANKNCKYCPYKTNFELCPKENRMKI